MALTSPGVIKTTNEILIGLAPEITMVKQFTYDISNEVADRGADSTYMWNLFKK